MSPAPQDHPSAVEALAEARRQTEALALFSRRMAHDLSNFLTVIRTYSELMQADLPPDHPNRADLDEIAQSADLTVTYVQRTSAFSRASTAKQTPFALDELVLHGLQRADMAALGPLEITAGSGATVTGPAPLLTEALQELATNAREASGPGAVIHVEARTDVRTSDTVEHGVPIAAGHWAIVDIIDSGNGLAPDVAASAFAPFVSTKSGARGAGFGLPMARCAAWAAGGEVTLGREGDRTVARLYLPVETAAPITP